MRELRPPIGPERWWAEAWTFEWRGPPTGGVRIAVLPRQRKAWFWAAVVRNDHPYVLCRDLELDPPSTLEAIELRGQALWAHAICETPFEHWTVAMEAFAVALDDPLDAWYGERGERVGLAFDLEWECARPIIEPTEPYALDCTVNGTLQIGDDRWDLSCGGRRSHTWGVQDAAWWDAAPGDPAALVMAPILVEAEEEFRLLWPLGA